MCTPLRVATEAYRVAPKKTAAFLGLLKPVVGFQSSFLLEEW